MIYEFSPKQDLHGYAKPWAPGAGKNQMPPPPDKTVTQSGITVTVKDGIYKIKGITTASTNMTFVLDESFTILSGDDSPKIALNNTQALSPNGFFRFNNESTIIESWLLYPENRVSEYAQYGTMEGATCDRYVLSVNAANVNVDMTLAPMLIENAVTDYSFAPFANICPPEGYNIWDPTAEEMIQVYAGYVNANTRELYLRPVYKEYAGEELVGPWMSSLDEYSEDATPTEGAFVIDFGGELESFEITPFMLQTLLDSLGIRQHFTNGAGLLNSLMDQAQGRVRSEEELLNRSLPLHVIAIGEDLPTSLVIKKPVSDVLPGLPGKIKI